jgi:hypothetical protein
MEAMMETRQDSASLLLGTWKLLSFTTEELDTGQTARFFGDHPSGYLNYCADGRMYAILLADERKAPADLVPTDAERIDLYNGLCSYAGTYRIDGDQVSHRIDVSWNQSWTGTTQVRRYRIDGNRLHITTLPAQNPLTGRECVSELVWIKVE